MCGIKQFTKEFLISELIRFYNENGRSPTQTDFQNSDYPSPQTYVRYIGGWVPALKLARLPLNRDTPRKLTGDELCSICKHKTSDGWYKHGDVFICNKCHKSDRKYVTGVLDINTTDGFGLLGEYIVHKTLNNSIWYNNNIDTYNYKFDIYDKLYGYIDVKTAKVFYSYHTISWRFNLKNLIKIKNTSEPNYYFLLGFDETKTNIQHVWVIPSNSNDIVNKNVINISNTEYNNNKFNKYKIDVTPFNNIYKNLNIHDIYHFRNIQDNIGDIIV